MQAKGSPFMLSLMKLTYISPKKCTQFSCGNNCKFYISYKIILKFFSRFEISTNYKKIIFKFYVRSLTIITMNNLIFFNHKKFQ